MRKAENTVKISGILSEMNLKYGSYVKDGRTIDTIGGDIRVRVHQKVNNEMVTMEIPVYQYSAKVTKNGTPNAAYVAIERMMNEYVSIAAAGGEDKADHVLISRGEIRMNEFPSADGTIVTTPRIFANFVTKVNSNPPAECAVFDIEFALNGIKRVVDSEGVELDPVKDEIEALIFAWDGQVSPMKIHTATPEAANWIENHWDKKHGTYRASGIINYSSGSQMVQTMDGFAGAISEMRTVSVKEFLMDNGSPQAYEEGNSWTTDEVKNALVARDARLKEALDHKRPAVTNKAPSNMRSGLNDLGF